MLMQIAVHSGSSGRGAEYEKQRQWTQDHVHCLLDHWTAGGIRGGWELEVMTGDIRRWLCRIGHDVGPSTKMLYC